MDYRKHQDIDPSHRPSNCVITGLSIAVALAAHGQPHPKSNHHHQQTDNHHILPRTSLTTLRGDAFTTISWDQLRGGSCCSNRGIEISKCMLIVVVLLVYSIFYPNHLFTALMPRHVNPRILLVENNKARAHFLVEVKKIEEVFQASETCQSSFDQELGASRHHKHSEHI